MIWAGKEDGKVFQMEALAGIMQMSEKQSPKDSDPQG